VFRRIEQGGKEVAFDRLTDRHVARLVKRTALAAGVRAGLPEAERAQKFAGHSLRAGLASTAEVDERYVQKQLGHASAEMTRRYQRRRDRFRVNLTKAAQAVVGNVTTGPATGGGGESENGGQPFAPGDARALAFAPGVPLWSADPRREAVPVAGGEGQEPMPDARRSSG
jgi:Phage integrase family